MVIAGKIRELRESLPKVRTLRWVAGRILQAEDHRAMALQKRLHHTITDGHAGGLRDVIQQHPASGRHRGVEQTPEPVNNPSFRWLLEIERRHHQHRGRTRGKRVARQRDGIGQRRRARADDHGHVTRGRQGGFSHLGALRHAERRGLTVRAARDHPGAAVRPQIRHVPGDPRQVDLAVRRAKGGDDGGENAAQVDGQTGTPWTNYELRIANDEHGFPVTGHWSLVTNTTRAGAPSQPAMRSGRQAKS